jgi:signal peptidase I
MIRVVWFALALFGLTLASQSAGVRILVVVGNSMEPSIRNGDLVITTSFWERDDVGSIILVKRPSDGQLLLHRVIEHGAGWRRTKGDASLSPDAERIPDDAVLGGLAAVIPAGLLEELPLQKAAAQFSAIQHTGVSITSSAGARVALSGPVLVGTDALGQLYPGGRATWLLTLTPCPIGLGGECTGSTNALRIDAERFTPLSSGGLARSLRLTTTCRPVGTSTWVDTSDLFTAAWSSGNLATGRLASLAAGADSSECQIQVTLLGSIAAANGAIALPLRWGPE